MGKVAKIGPVAASEPHLEYMITNDAFSALKSILRAFKTYNN